MLTHLYLLSFESKGCKEKEVDVNNVIKTPEPRQIFGVSPSAPSCGQMVQIHNTPCILKNSEETGRL